MTRRIIASLAAAGVAILASCTQDQRPSALLPTEASLVKPPAAPSCSFSTANQDARNYFSPSTGPTKDAVFGLLDAMQLAYTSGGASGATSAGFDVLTRLGEAVGTSAAVGTPEQGSQFANDVLLCMQVNGYVYAAGQFTSALSSGGLFAVRANGSPDYVRARSGRFGAEPTTDTGWPITSGQALFYGAPLSNQSTLSKETLIGGTAFSLNTLPTPLTFSPLIRVGICDIRYEEPLTIVPRLLHVHSGTPVVLATNAPAFCPSSFTSIDAPSSMFASTVHHLASWLSPKPAYAATMALTCCKIGGGTVGGLSDIGTIAPQDTIIFTRVLNAKVSDSTAGKDSIVVGTLPDTMTIADTTTSQFQPPVTVQVLAKASKAPIGGVVIHITVLNNKGSYFADGGTATTDAQGYARFPNFYINKAGGYTISAQAATAEGFDPNFVATSNQFQISGQ